MNTRLAVATHILTFLTVCTGRPASSETIASSVNTNASLVRRLLVSLNKAGLTMSAKGVTGGAQLKRDPADITLLDVYHAVDDERGMFTLHPDPNPYCRVGRTITDVLQPRFEAAEASMLASLGKITIADIAADVADRNRAMSSGDART
jgi:Rrf2 family protein